MVAHDWRCPRMLEPRGDPGHPGRAQRIGQLIRRSRRSRQMGQHDPPIRMHHRLDRPASRVGHGRTAVLPRDHQPVCHGARGNVASLGRNAHQQRTDGGPDSISDRRVDQMRQGIKAYRSVPGDIGRAIGLAIEAHRERQHDSRPVRPDRSPAGRKRRGRTLTDLIAALCHRYEFQSSARLRQIGWTKLRDIGCRQHPACTIDRSEQQDQADDRELEDEGRALGEIAEIDQRQARQLHQRRPADEQVHRERAQITIALEQQSTGMGDRKQGEQDETACSACAAIGRAAQQHRQPGAQALVARPALRMRKLAHEHQDRPDHAGAGPDGSPIGTEPDAVLGERPVGMKRTGNLDTDTHAHRHPDQHGFALGTGQPLRHPIGELDEGDSRNAGKGGDPGHGQHDETVGRQPWHRIAGPAAAGQRMKQRDEKARDKAPESEAEQQRRRGNAATAMLAYQPVSHIDRQHERQQQLDQKADRAGVPVQRLHRVTHGSGSVGAHRLADMPMFRQDPPGPRRFDPPAWQKWAGR